MGDDDQQEEEEHEARQKLDLRLIISAIDIDLERGYVKRKKGKERNHVACLLLHYF